MYAYSFNFSIAIDDFNLKHTSKIFFAKRTQFLKKALLRDRLIRLANSSGKTPVPIKLNPGRLVHWGRAKWRGFFDHLQSLIIDQFVPAGLF